MRKAQQTAMKLVALAKNPVPSGAEVGAFEGHDGGAMRYARWEPTRGPNRGTVCVFTGRGEFIEKYFEVVADLRRRGFDVAMMDWRGQGASYRPLRNPRKAWVRDFSEYDRDLACFMQQVVQPACPAPYYALAHSMGGHILLRNAGGPDPWFSRMILSAPMLSFHDRQIGIAQHWARLYLAVSRRLGFGRFYVRGGSDDASEPAELELSELTSDRDRLARNRALAEAAPEMLTGWPTIGWMDAAYRSMALLNEPDYASNISIPLMIFIAGRDSIVNSRVTETFASRLKVGAPIMLATAKHEILQETDEIRGRFWAAFDAYLGVGAEA